MCLARVQRLRAEGSTNGRGDKKVAGPTEVTAGPATELWRESGRDQASDRSEECVCIELTGRGIAHNAAES